jgi:hypothetical protein
MTQAQCRFSEVQGCAEGEEEVESVERVEDGGCDGSIGGAEGWEGQIST